MKHAASGLTQNLKTTMKWNHNTKARETRLNHKWSLDTGKFRTSTNCYSYSNINWKLECKKYINGGAISKHQERDLQLPIWPVGRLWNKVDTYRRCRIKWHCFVRLWWSWKPKVPTSTTSEGVMEKLFGHLEIALSSCKFQDGRQIDYMCINWWFRNGVQYCNRKSKIVIMITTCSWHRNNANLKEK